VNRKPVGKRLKNWLIYVAVVFVVKLLRSLPRGAAIKIMRFLGALAFRLAGKEREKTIRHLTWVFGYEKSPEEIESLARQVFLNLSTAAADAIRLPVIIREGINNLVTIQGIEHLQKSLANGKGAIWLTGHFGNWELLGAYLAQNGLPLKVIGRTAYDPRLDKMIVDGRNQAGYSNIARGKGTREIIRALRDGYAIGMLIDQDTNVEGVFVNFFGRPAHTATGPVVLAQKFGAPIASVFMRLCPDFSYQIECGEEIVLQNTGDADADLIANTQKCSNVYERMIRRYPDQWVWMHERWKKQQQSVGTN